MKKIKLKDYQEKQLLFLKQHTFANKICAIQSGTGSGKTFVFLSFIKWFLEQPENAYKNVVITTGFNNLVFQIEEEARDKFDLLPIVLIGRKAINCPVLWKERAAENSEDPARFKPFTFDGFARDNDDHKYFDKEEGKMINECPYKKDAYFSVLSKITEGVGNVIITNHSTFLAHNELFSSIDLGLCIIDECHTFPTFYDTFLRKELTSEQIGKMKESIEKNTRGIMKKIILSNIEKGVILPKAQKEEIINAINKEVVKTKSIKSKVLSSEVNSFFEELEMSMQNGKKLDNKFIKCDNNGFFIDTFYHNISAPQLSGSTRVCLFSATVDKFTRRLFSVQDLHFYSEQKVFADYSKSKFVGISQFKSDLESGDFKEALRFFMTEEVEKRKLSNGMILCTTIKNMNIATKLLESEFSKYTLFTDHEEFIKSKKRKKILIGSRGLFQGINIRGLKFVVLDKIPFPLYDEKQQAKVAYLDKYFENTWKEYTVPSVENDIIQATGRLWRSSEDCGVIAILDARLKKFNYMITDSIRKYRKGIEEVLFE